MIFLSNYFLSKDCASSQFFNNKFFCETVISLMKNKRTPRVYDLKLWPEKHAIKPPDISEDGFDIMTFIYPILMKLSSIGISQDDIKNYVSLFKIHSQKSKMGSSSNTKMMNRDHFSTIFQFLYAKIGKPDSFNKRIFRRMEHRERNIVFTYFAALFPAYMYQIAKNFFNEFDFKEKLYQKEELSENFIRLTHEVQKLKNSFDNIQCNILDYFSDERISFLEDGQYDDNNLIWIW